MSSAGRRGYSFLFLLDLGVNEHPVLLIKLGTRTIHLSLQETEPFKLLGGLEKERANGVEGQRIMVFTARKPF